MHRKQIALFALIVVSFFSQIRSETKVIAHRGASSVAPENTLAAFKKAAEFRADYFELDVYFSKDDSLVVIHDKSVNRTTDGSGFVSLLTFAQLRELDAGSWFDEQFAGEKIPTLKEALLVGKENDVKVCVEIKASAPGIVEKVVDLIEKLNMESRVIIFSFNFEQISLAKQLNPAIPVLYLFEVMSTEKIDKAKGIDAQAVGAGGVADPDLIDYAHQNNIEVWRWTVNSAAEMSEMIALNIDGIITNYPQLLRAILEDVSPPSDVAAEEATVSGTSIALKWQPAVDPESGIAGYEIYRDTTADAAALLASVGNTTTFTDETFQEATTFYYRIKAVNYAGLKSDNFSNAVFATTENDAQPPEIINVIASGEATTLYIEFSERINEAMATDISNYEIDNSATVDSATLALNGKTVVLRTSELSEGVLYQVVVKHIKDLARVPNAANDLTAEFRHHGFPSGLIAAWSMDEGVGETIRDISGNDNTGVLYNGVAWTEGKLANGLYFDGKDDYVQLPNSESLNVNNDAVTLSAWVKLEVLPSEMSGSYGPIYDSDQDCYVLYEDRGNGELRFKVTTTSGAERPGIKESDLPLNEWLHIVGVYDGSQAMIYMNGALMDSHGGLSGQVKTGQVARLGENINSYFKGAIDNVQVYNRALSEEEIGLVYSGVKTLIEKKEQRDRVAVDFQLQQNYPNPFNPSTTIQYRLPAATFVELSIFNSLGKEIRRLIEGEKPAGEYEATWDGRDQRGRQAPSGVYFYRLKAGDFTEVREMALMR